MSQFTRRDALRAVGSATLVGLAGCQTGATDELCGSEPPSTESTIPTESMGSTNGLSSDAAWPMARHDASQTGFTDDVGPTKNVRLAWTAQVGIGGRDTLPVVADGTVVATFAGNGSLRVLSPADGSVEWSVDSLSRPSHPVVAANLVVVGDATGLHAFDLADGSEQWTVAPEVERTATDSQPTANGETDTGSAPEGDQSDVTSPAARNSVRFTAPPLYADETILTRSNLGVHAFRRDGTERWRREQLYLGAMADGTAYLMGPPGLVAVDVQSGTEQWTREGPGFGPNVAVRDGTLYGGDSGTVTAIDAKSGDTEWTFDGESESFASPTVTPNTVFVASSPQESADGGNLYALDRDSGKPNWCTYLGSKTVNSPGATTETVFIPAENVVEARAVGSGELQWRYGTGDGLTLFDTPVVADGHLLVGTDDGTVRAFAEE